MHRAVRRAGIARAPAAASAVLDRFRPDYNRRFAVSAVNPVSVR